MFDGLTVYFIRHGETDWNLGRRLQGTTDIPLNATGRLQAARHGRELAALDLDWPAYDFQASPLSRAAETMEIVRGEIGAAAPEPSYDDRLVEVAFGKWEGRTWSDIVAEEPQDHARYIGDAWNEAPHGGESYGDMAVRLQAWASSLKRDTIVAAHGGVSRVVRGLYLGIPTDEVLSLSTPQTLFYRFRDGQVDTI